MTTITTTIAHTSTGATRIVAKGKGKQRTISYDHATSHDRQHGEAAGTLALVLGLPNVENISHEIVDGNTHKFAWN